MAGKTTYLQNRYIDWLFRAQTFTPGATLYIGLYTAAPTDIGGGTEVTGGAYARVSVTSSLVNWAGTQSAGSTTASSSTASPGVTSNNSAITFAAPTANWGSVTSMGIFDAATTGNLLYWANLTTAKTVNNGDAAPSFLAAALTIGED